MDTVWKFPLGYKGDVRFVIEVPEGATPLRVDFDPRGELVLWARVQTDAPTLPAVVTVVGTGEQVPPGAGDYVSTFISEPFVFHSFYSTEPTAQG